MLGIRSHLRLISSRWENGERPCANSMPFHLRDQAHVCRFWGPQGILEPVSADTGRDGAPRSPKAATQGSRLCSSGRQRRKGSPFPSQAISLLLDLRWRGLKGDPKSLLHRGAQCHGSCQLYTDSPPKQRVQGVCEALKPTALHIWLESMAGIAGGLWGRLLFCRAGRCVSLICLDM